MLHRLQPDASTSASPARHPIRALILVPTRELAIQVYESVKAYGKYIPLRCSAIYGGVDIEPQIKALRAGVEILVATPGRLIDHVQQKTLTLGKLEILVLDEADRMLDMGFLPDIKRILTLLPAQRQSLMFSATFSGEIKKLANTLLNDPVLIEVARQNSIAELITHVVYPVARTRKRDLLTHLIKSQDLKQVLVFVRTKHGASRLAQQLERDGITATAIHGDKSQPQRTQALAEFKEGAARVLVATDVAARGLDIEDLPHVVNFELPTTPEDYIHRIGRTGRAGTKGDALSLVCDDEQELLNGIEKLLKFKINSEVIPGFEADMEADQRGEPRRGQVTDAYRREAFQGGQKKSVELRPGRAEKTKPPFPLDGRHPSRDRGEHKTYRDRTGTSGGKYKVSEDPLFTQPYIPSPTSSLAPPIPQPTESHSNYYRPGRPNQPLAALFRPRPRAKPTQDGS